MRIVSGIRFPRLGKAVLLAGVLSCLWVLHVSEKAQAARWPLVIFGNSLGNTQTPHGDWMQILRHPTYTEFVDPDGTPEHDGLAQTASTPDGETAYFGIRGTTSINFQVGQKIVATFYNRSSNEEYLSCRVSFTDANDPDPLDTGNAWHTMYSTDEAYELPFRVPVPGHSLMELE